LKIPIVIDTNVLISGYLWSGKPRQAIKIVSDPPYVLLYCRESLTELVRILSKILPFLRRNHKDRFKYQT
jgi:predicted nucleic acid-binding protein